VWSGYGVGEEKGDGGGFATERDSKGMALATVEQAGDQIVVYGLINLMAMRALWAFRFPNTAQVLVKEGMPSA
jgi:hypothetical protein